MLTVPAAAVVVPDPSGFDFQLERRPGDVPTEEEIAAIANQGGDYAKNKNGEVYLAIQSKDELDAQKAAGGAVEFIEDERARAPDRSMIVPARAHAGVLARTHRTGLAGG